MDKHIALFIPSLERGGVERTLVSVSKGFVARGLQVDLVVCRAGEAFLRQVPRETHIVYIGVRRPLPGLSRLVPPRVSVSLMALPGLVCYLRRRRPDAVISFQASVVAVWAKALAGIPVRLVVRESNTPSQATSQAGHVLVKLVPYLKRWSYPRADAIMAVSEGAADDLARVLGIPRDRINVVYNPTYDGSIHEKAKEPVEHPWFRSGEPPVIIGVGRLTAQKDFSTLFRAFAKVCEELTARLVILGEGDERSKLEALAKQLGIEQDVSLPGFVENPYKYMARASLFALSSRYEGLPNALIEALAVGCPVVSTDCPSGPREILLGGAAGPLVPVGNAEALAKATTRLLTDRDHAQRLVDEGRKHLYRFRPETCLQKYLELVRAA